MFHSGDLQSGISLAISQGKLVACFVRDDNEESRVWEEDWLGQDPCMVSQGTWRPTVGNMFTQKAVLLRIQFGSQEASFLSAFCPITTAPTFVIIQNGRVLEKVEGGLEKREFIERTSSALGLEFSVMTRQEYHARAEARGNGGPEEVADADAMRTEMEHGQHQASQEEAQTSSGSQDPPNTEEAAPTEPPQSSSSHPRPSEPPPHEASDMSSLFPDRAQRLEEEKAKREAAAKAEKAARANARRKEAEEAHAEHTSKGKGKEKAGEDTTQKEKSRRDWIVQQKQRKDEAKKERERILAQIEADKLERKARSQRAPEAPSEPLPTSLDAASKRRSGAGGVCNLSVRLFDGSSVKHRFEPSAILATAVRDWIKQQVIQQDGNSDAANVPYTFKQILAPLPSRNIEVSEEHQSLQDLGLAPNATLVLVPVSGYTDAYSGAGRGYVGTALNAAYNVASTASNVVSYALSFVPGLGGTTESSDGAVSGEQSYQSFDGAGEASTASGTVKVKTLADQRAEALKQKDRKAEFYNGNSSAFEGRKDDDEGVTR